MRATAPTLTDGFKQDLRTGRGAVMALTAAHKQELASQGFTIIRGLIDGTCHTCARSAHKVHTDPPPYYTQA